LSAHTMLLLYSLRQRDGAERCWEEAALTGTWYIGVNATGLLGVGATRGKVTTDALLVAPALREGVAGLLVALRSLPLLFSVGCAAPAVWTTAAAGLFAPTLISALMSGGGVIVFGPFC
jgi:hypothetical protein